MTPEKLAQDARQAIADGTNMTLVMQPGQTRRLPGFPRGELLCENSKNEHVRSYKPEKILKWLRTNKLIEEIE